jgi:hypothetical protein
MDKNMKKNFTKIEIIIHLFLMKNKKKKCGLIAIPLISLLIKSSNLSIIIIINKIKLVPLFLLITPIQIIITLIIIINKKLIIETLPEIKIKNN